MSSRRRDRRAAAHALRPDSFQPRLGRIPIQGGRFHDNCMRATLPGVSLACNHVSSRIPQRRFYAKGHALISVASLQLPIRKGLQLGNRRLKIGNHKLTAAAVARTVSRLTPPQHSSDPPSHSDEFLRPSTKARKHQVRRGHSPGESRRPVR